MTRVRARHHRDSHSAYPATPAAPTLAYMTEQTANVSTDVDNAHTVEVFLSALQDQDLDTAAAQLDDNLVYENVGYPTIRGRARAVKLFRGLQRPNLGFEAKIHRIAVNGATVLTERTDVLVIGPMRMQFWVCGVFEVRNGRITLWRDYFDMFDMLKGTVRGIVGAVVPALRPRL
jgi:limonene-1,2-epoxide hydrolase